MSGKVIEDAIQSAARSALFTGIFAGGIGVLVIQWTWPLLRAWIHWATREGHS